ncbi:hypothetical protein HELRODRAFT_183159 [Helobdella robusta]|uniref:Uncharacterized protein n=1 Tax=Helobdella robusta TaxID=6412 RepID=T1FJ84_HELRO|nr:hypothetical protein HELRODRAFT_183159 [Helobdella robusta]ESO11464.1 hypothetical protein HELRODRAFT_183159 [Helobdella robusta]
MSTERLMTKMIKSGRDEAEVRSMSRQEIIDACLASELMRTELLTETSEPPQNVTETERWKFEKELEFKERQAAKELEFKERQAAKEFVEIDGKRQHVHANKIKQYYERMEQAMISSCTLIREKDVELGRITTFEKDYQNIYCQLDPRKLDHLSTLGKEEINTIISTQKQRFSPTMLKGLNKYKLKKLRFFGVLTKKLLNSKWARIFNDIR